MRRTAGAASPASAALIRRRRDGDPTRLRDSFIRVLLGKASPLRAMLGTWRSCDNLVWPSRASESLRPPVARRLLCERSELHPAAWQCWRRWLPLFPQTRCDCSDTLWLHSASVGHCKEQSKNNERGRMSSRRFLSTTLGRSLRCSFRVLRSYACTRVASPWSMRDFG